MYIDIYPDTQHEYEWLYDNGFVELSWDELENRAYNDRPIPNLSDEIEVDYDFTPEYTDRHPYGSTTATEYHSAQIYITKATYMGLTKQVDSPSWLEERIEEEL